MNAIKWQRLKSPLFVLVLTLGISTICIGYGHRRFGSFTATIDFVRGQRLLVDSRSRAVGDIPIGAVVTLRYLITNWTGRPIRLVGSRASCTCAMIEKSSRVLADGESRQILVEVTAPEQAGEIVGVVEVLTDDPRYQKLPLSFHGRAVSSDARPSR